MSKMNMILHYIIAKLSQKWKAKIIYQKTNTLGFIFWLAFRTDTFIRKLM
jgi:hypothetical protein